MAEARTIGIQHPDGYECASSISAASIQLFRNPLEELNHQEDKNLLETAAEPGPPRID